MSTEKDRMIRHGQELMASRCWFDAVRILKQVVKMDPGDETACSLLVKGREALTHEETLKRSIEEALSRGDLDRAVGFLKELMRFSPEREMIEQRISYLENIRDKKKNSEETRNRIIENRRLQKIQELIARGRAAIMDERWDEATTFFEDILKLNPRSSDARAMIVHIEVQRNLDMARKRSIERRWPEAVIYLKKALKIEPNNEEAARRLIQAETCHVMNTGRLRMEQKKYSEAVGLFRRALDIDGTNEEAGMGLNEAEAAQAMENGRWLLAAGQHENAAAAFQKVLALQPHNQTAKQMLDHVRSLMALPSSKEGPSLISALLHWWRRLVKQ